MNLFKKSDIVRLAVFCSGTGSNFKALYRNIQERHLPCEIVMCLSNNSQCGAMAFAREVGIDAVHLSAKTHPVESEYVAAMLHELRARAVDYILLAGYMKKVPRAVVEAYPKRILNIHPALLPKFGGEGMYGLNVHRAVLASGERESGATVHFVEADYDTGEIILQRRVPVFPDDTPETLAARVQAVEHVLYTDALEKVLQHS
ncbi:MAG: phosphoribosylglycinamide formyltransferase [Chloroherpetonaceae bacterium]|nr:phosphoribosylglycinamide formyltransferase [Chloroherpetonaceae bacterium]MCS7211697.1 phosphoribosylglycinamide formyltransferase [Chloroherpetonaceae bacterium]MDW8018635.1 phosphoribosylglycinamide formyltransferase [Chloroherpetonaceae bacterium]